MSVIFDSTNAVGDPCASSAVHSMVSLFPDIVLEATHKARFRCAKKQKALEGSETKTRELLKETNRTYII